MSDASLLIKIGADTQDAVKGIQATKDKLSELYAKMDEAKTRQALLVNPQNIREAQKEIDALAKEIDALGNNQGFEKLGASTDNVVKGANEAFSAIRKIAYILPGIGVAGIFNLGFEAISKFISALRESGDDLEKETAATKKYDDAAKSLEKTLSDIKSASQITGEATGGTAGEVAKLYALRDAVLDLNLTYKERQRALDQVNDATKSQSANLDLETVTYEKLTAKITEYANALIAAAVVKGFTDEITKQTIEYNKQADTLGGLKTRYEQAQKALADYHKANEADQFSSGTSGTTLKQIELQNAVTETGAAFFKARNGVDQLGESVVNYKDKLVSAIDESLKFKPLTAPKDGSGGTDNSLAELKRYIADSAKITADAEQKEIIEETDKYNKLYADLVKFNHDTEDATQQHQKNLADIQNKYIAINAGIISKAFAEEKAKELKATQDGNLKLQNETESYIQKSQSIGKTATQKAIDEENLKFEKLKEAHMLGDGQIEDIEAQHIKNLKAITDKGQEADDVKQIGINVADFKLNFDKNTASKGINQAVDEVIKKINEEKSAGHIDIALKMSAHIPEEVKKQFQKDVGDDIKKLLENVSESAVEGIGTALGNLASGIKNPFASVLKEIGSILGDGLIAIGKKLIEASGIMVAINKAIAALNIQPEVGILVGIAAIAAGTLLKNEVAQTAAHAFAEGGIVTGPTLGLVGEAGPEVIFPLTKLNQFVKGNASGAQVITIRGQLSGNHINLLSKRAANQTRLAS